MPSTTIHHLAVWLDHHEARVFRIQRDSFDESTFKLDAHHVRRHRDRNASQAAHPEDAKHFFRDVAAALEGADEILVLGPSTAKLELLKYLGAHAPKVEARVVGVETVDHPTDPQLAAYARRYFHEVDRMRGLAP
jgi:stalled ribosome rescue protein Dom34